VTSVNSFEHRSYFFNTANGFDSLHLHSYKRNAYNQYEHHAMMHQFKDVYDLTSVMDLNSVCLSTKLSVIWLYLPSKVVKSLLSMFLGKS